MTSLTTSDRNCWENKDFDSWFEPVENNDISFFDLSFAIDAQDVFGSSDYSIASNFFDDIDLGSTSIDASVFSNTSDFSNCAQIAYSVSAAGSDQHAQQHVPATAPVPRSQRLAHALRPDGFAISSEDLLNIEGRAPAALKAPKTPPSTPNHKSGQDTPKTPRTPKERRYRVGKSTSSTKKAMQPSNYYCRQDSPSSSDWNERFQRFTLLGNSMPLSPPPSTKVEQNAYPTRMVIAGAQPLRIPDSPTPSHAMSPLSVSAMGAESHMHHQLGHSIEYETQQISPLTPSPWIDASGDLTFSPVSPLIDNSAWDANASAQMHNATFSPDVDTHVHNGYSSHQELDLHQPTFPAADNGLMIDFGDSVNMLAESFLQNNEPIAADDFETQLDQTMAQQNSQSGSQSRSSPFASLHSTSPTPSPTLTTTTTISSRRMARSSTTATAASTRNNRRSTLLVRRSSGDSSLQSTPTRMHRRTASSRSASGPSTSSSSSSALRGMAGTTGGKAGSGPAAATAKGGQLAPGADPFVNYTPSDSRRILTGVAPSGSSKTKARREKEAKENRRKLSEVAKRAVREAGGDWESIVGELVEV